MASETVEIGYNNWRGEYRKRAIYPKSIRFGTTQWHPEAQWLLEAVDIEDGKIKEFGMKDIHSWEPTP